MRGETGNLLGRDDDGDPGMCTILSYTLEANTFFSSRHGVIMLQQAGSHLTRSVFNTQMLHSVSGQFSFCHRHCSVTEFFLALISSVTYQNQF